MTIARRVARKPVRRRVADAQGSVRTEWLDVTRLGRVEVSSEDEAHPIARAFSSTGEGWRAAAPGEQVIRIAFRRPVTLHRIRVVFDEPSRDRTQEFTLGWSSHRGETHRQIVRQQFNFSRSGATREVEEYQVDLQDATAVELRIIPDIQRGDAVASLAEFRVA